jgi:hypothetical protein
MATIEASLKKVKAPTWVLVHLLHLSSVFISCFSLFDFHFGCICCWLIHMNKVIPELHHSCKSQNQTETLHKGTSHVDRFCPIKQAGEFKSSY